MTKCVEKQLNASVNQRVRVHKLSLFPVNTPAEGEESFLMDTQLFPFESFHGLVPGFNCFSHNRVEPTVLHSQRSAVSHLGLGNQHQEKFCK